MEPPCEHGGVPPETTPQKPSLVSASMEPPCEHGGVLGLAPGAAPECSASMEPPCEHGGVMQFASTRIFPDRLQWSRRVNTAECSRKRRCRPSRSSFNGAAV